MSESDDDDRILNEPLDKQDVHRDWVGATLTEWEEEIAEPVAEVSVLLLSI